MVFTGEFDAAVIGLGYVGNNGDAQPQMAGLLGDVSIFRFFISPTKGLSTVMTSVWAVYRICRSMYRAPLALRNKKSWNSHYCLFMRLWCVAYNKLYTGGAIRYNYPDNISISVYY